MALEYTSNWRIFTGTGNVSTYSVDFPVNEPAHIVLKVANASGDPVAYTQGVHYTVAILKNSSGHSIGAVVNLAAALPRNYTMKVVRTVPIIQPAVFDNQGCMTPKAVESSLDYLTMICQQLSSLLSVGDLSMDELVALIQRMDGTYLKLAGGSMAGPVDMGDNAVRFGNAYGFDKPKIDLSSGFNNFQLGTAAGGVLWYKARLAHQFYAADVSAATPIASIDKTDVYHDGTGLKAAINAKAAVSHTHAVADVAKLQASLDDKAEDYALDAANGRIARLEAGAKELESGLARSMPDAPADGRLYVAMGRAWYPLRLESGEPFERVGSAVQPVAGPASPTAVWNIGAGYAYTLKPDSKPGDSDSFFECVGAGSFVLKNLA